MYTTFRFFSYDEQGHPLVRPLCLSLLRKASFHHYTTVRDEGVPPVPPQTKLGAPNAPRNRRIEGLSYLMNIQTTFLSSFPIEKPSISDASMEIMRLPQVCERSRVCDEPSKQLARTSFSGIGWESVNIYYKRIHKTTGSSDQVQDARARTWFRQNKAEAGKGVSNRQGEYT